MQNILDGLLQISLQFKDKLNKGSVENHSAAVRDLVFSPDGQLIASVADDRSVRLWRRDEQLIATLSDALESARQPVTNTAGASSSSSSAIPQVAFSPDGQLLASNSQDRVVLWNWNLGLETLMHQGCTWLKDYLRTNPQVGARDRQLCDGVTRQGQTIGCPCVDP